MMPWQTAAAWWREHSGALFEERVGYYFARGYVWSTPEVFMLAREICWDGKQCVDGAPNAWFVELAAANEGCVNAVREMLRVAPHPHEWVCWCRRGERRIRAFAWGKLIRKAGLN